MHHSIVEYGLRYSKREENTGEISITRAGDFLMLLQA